SKKIKSKKLRQHQNKSRLSLHPGHSRSEIPLDACGLPGSVSPRQRNNGRLQLIDAPGRVRLSRRRQRPCSPIVGGTCDEIRSGRKRVVYRGSVPESSHV